MEDKQRLWAPWRGKYVIGQKEPGCVFCSKAKSSDDAADYILHRGRNIFVIMNLYPYNNGHLMLVPYRHIANITDMTADEASEMASLLSKSIEILMSTMSAEGFNVGYNIGSAAGAGIAAHIHQHIVPRWVGDSNFMPVIGDIKVISETMDDTYRRLRPAFERI